MRPHKSYVRLSESCAGLPIEDDVDVVDDDDDDDDEEEKEEEEEEVEEEEENLARSNPRRGNRTCCWSLVCPSKRFK